MKRYAPLILGIVLAISQSLHAQKLSFSYDASGNQTERRWVCINCPSAKQMVSDKKTLAKLNNEEIGNGLTTERGLKAYPNPLKEVLNLSWGVPEKIFLKTIDIYSVGGNSVFKKSYGPSDRQTSIPFQDLPPGTYLLLGRYSDDKTETVKLIKH